MLNFISIFLGNSTAIIFIMLELRKLQGTQYTMRFAKKKNKLTNRPSPDNV